MRFAAYMASCNSTKSNIIAYKCPYLIEKTSYGHFIAQWPMLKAIGLCAGSHWRTILLHVRIAA